MTDAELVTLLGFLTSGLLVGTVGHWLDMLVTFVRGK